jgi:nucleoid-associated protein YgaU
MTRIIALSLALIAACAAVFVFGTTYRQRPPQEQTTAQSETSAVAAAPATAPDAVKPVVSAAQNEAAAVTPAPKVTAESGPAFDVARINENGEAVIAGSATPGATVELLRDGQPHDSAVADASGQFVMTPPPLPPGEHELTLRAKAPDGTVMQSKNSVSVAVNNPAPGSGPAPSVNVATAAKQLPASVRQAHATEPASRAAPVRRHHPVASVVARAETDTNTNPLRAATIAGMGSPMTKVVSPGDSLWLISRLAYGDGMRYALIFKANRDRIRNPDRIYPGQTFVLPANAR